MPQTWFIYIHTNYLTICLLDTSSLSIESTFQLHISSPPLLHVAYWRSQKGFHHSSLLVIACNEKNLQSAYWCMTEQEAKSNITWCFYEDETKTIIYFCLEADLAQSQPDYWATWKSRSVGVKVAEPKQGIQWNILLFGRTKQSVSVQHTDKDVQSSWCFAKRPNGYGKERKENLT